MEETVNCQNGNGWLGLAMITTLFIGLGSVGYFSKEIAFFIIS